jgi:hypothetical protein
MPTAISSRVPASLLVGAGAMIFLANAGLLVLQLVAGRFLAPFIGSSIETWTCVIGVFLAGIALGNWLGGRVADRFPSPRTVAVLLALSGLAALGMIGFYEWSLANGYYKLIPLGARIPLLATLLCLPPAVLLSLLTPVTIKLLLPDVASAGRIAGLIFALSTLGCLIGNYYTGFWLMADYTLNQITMGVGVGLILLAIPAFLYPRRETTALGPASAEPLPDPLPDGAWNFRGNIRFAYAVVFLASFCGMSLELTGTRLLAPHLGVSLFTWTGIIGVMLAGTCCGNYLGGVLADRGVGPAVRRLAFILCGLIGVVAAPALIRQIKPDFNDDGSFTRESLNRLIFGLFGVALVFPGIAVSKWRRGPLILSALLGGLIGMALARSAGHALARVVNVSAFTTFHERLSDMLGFDAGPWLIHGLGFVVGIAIALLFLWDAPKGNERTSRSATLCGSLFLAGAFSLAILLLMGVYTNSSFMLYEEQITQKVVAWTFGLFFLPMLALGTISPQVIRLAVSDVARAGRVAGSVYAWSTVGAIVGTFATGYFLISAVGTFRVILILAFALTLLSFFVGQLWKNNAMLYAVSIIFGGAIFGLYLVDYGSSRFDLETKYYAIKVSVKENAKGRRHAQLDLDHLAHSIVDLDDVTWLYYDHEYIQGELLNLARHQHERANLLVIGGGGYSFPRFVEHLWPDVSNEVVEIDPGVTRIAREKLGLSPDSSIRTHNMDGRQFISEKAPKGHYHLVMQDAVNDFSVPAHLMTVEYNNLVKQTLAPGGGYLLTFIDSLRSGRFWRAAVNTMRQSFTHVYLLSPSGFHQVDDDGKRLIRKTRSVYIVYGSDTPLDEERLAAVTRDFIAQQRRQRENAIATVAPLAVETADEIAEWMLRSYTHVLPAEELDALLDDPKFPKITLRDQYCPVDNLMSDIFRDNLKRK